MQVALPLLAVVGLLVATTAWFFDGTPDPEVDQIGRLREGVVDLLLFASVMGVCSMAFVEMAKRTLLLRGRFHGRQLMEALGPLTLGELVDPLRPRSSPTDPVVPTASRDVALRRLDLPLEQLCAQLGEVAEGALARLSGAPRTPREPPSDGRDEALLAEFCGARGRQVLRDLAVPGREDTDVVSTELRRLVLSSLDSFQVVTGSRWRSGVRLWAASLAALLALLTVLALGAGPLIKTVAVAGAFVIGGVVAWTARDVLAAVERLRDR